MKLVMLTGVDGQLGSAICKNIPSNIKLVTTNRSHLDLSDFKACYEFVRSLRPDWIINAAAYTDVDGAEISPLLAHTINSEAPRAFALALSETGGSLLQLSTDYVFSGNQGLPYKINYPCNPLNVYGHTKASCEKVISKILGTKNNGNCAILRTSWLYSQNKKSFLSKILVLLTKRLKTGNPLCVVADQIGSPTSATGLAAACWAIVKSESAGIYHWSDAGVASWYDFAIAINETALEQGLITSLAKIIPISSVEYPSLARRPSYSVLDCTSTRKTLNLKAHHWRSSLYEVMTNINQIST